MESIFVSHHERVIFLTGIPQLEESKLESVADSNEQFLPAFVRFLNKCDQSGDDDTRYARTTSATPRPMIANWRSIGAVYNVSPRNGNQLPYHYSAYPSETMRDRPSSDLSSLVDDNVQANTSSGNFHQHSFMWHENLNCSKVINSEGDTDFAADITSPPNTTTNSKVASTDSEYSSNEDSFLDRLELNRLRPTALSDLPTADYVNNIMPQTVTVSLLVVVLQLDARRQIEARRSGRRYDLVELLVGDDTRSVFNINIWLKPFAEPSVGLRTPLTGRGTEESFRSVLNSLKVGNMLLLKNIALATWKGNLYGQNLRKRVGSIETEIEVIERRHAGSYAPTSYLEERIRDVQTWATSHVQIMYSPNGDQTERPRPCTFLPPDTQ